MVRKQKLCIIIDNCTARGRAAEVSISAVIIVNRLIDIREKCVHSGNDVIGTAERTHNAGLLQRITLFHCQLCIAYGVRYLRPACKIVPIGVCTQEKICTDKRCIFDLIHILTISTARGPVHKAAHFKGCRISHCNTNGGRNAPCTRLIFVRRYCAVKGNNHTQTGCSRIVLTGTVDAVATAQLLNLSHNRVSLPTGDIIKVKGNNIPAGYIVRLTARITERAADKAAYVLQSVLLSLFHFHIISIGLYAFYWITQALIQLCYC